MMWLMGKKTKRKKKRQEQKVLLLKKETGENKKFLELLEALKDLEKQEKYIDIQICPRCKSHRIRRVRSTNGDITGHLGWLPAKFECFDCGWRERLVLNATNRKLGPKQVAIIAEALNFKE